MIDLKQQSSLNPTIVPASSERRRSTWRNDLLYLFPTIGLGTFGLCIALAIVNPVEISAPADPFATPDHLLPEWYLLPVYQLVRLIPHKIVGIVTMVGFATGLLLLPLIENLDWFNPRLRRTISIGIFAISTIESIPFVGSTLRTILTGGDTISSQTIVRLYTLHSYVLLLVAVGLSIVHLVGLTIRDRELETTDLHLKSSE